MPSSATPSVRPAWKSIILKNSNMPRKKGKKGEIKPSKRSSLQNNQGEFP
jgi:hypothetical protein